jgi:glucose dehydrogenase
VPNAPWKLLLTAGMLSSVLAVPAARAGDDLVEMQSNAADYVMPTQTYDNQRYSALKQINAQNVGKLHVAWEFSTGVLRGHEGAPLVIGDVMYLTE